MECAHRNAVPCADFGGGLESAHFGHLYVHQDDVEALSLEGGQCFDPVVRGHYRVAALVQQPHGELLVDRLSSASRMATEEERGGGFSTAGTAAAGTAAFGSDSTAVARAASPKRERIRRLPAPPELVRLKQGGEVEATSLSGRALHPDAPRIRATNWAQMVSPRPGPP